MIAEKGEQCGCQIEVFQSNHEGAIIDRIQDSYFDGTQGIVINPGAYTHYSYAIHDALGKRDDSQGGDSYLGYHKERGVSAHFCHERGV